MARPFLIHGPSLSHILRRSAVGIYYHWRRRRKNLRQSTFKDFHDAMNRFNHRLAFATITARRN